MSIPILTGAAMRRADQTTISELGIPGLTLMETAGRGIVGHMLDRIEGVRDKHVLVVCGKGNNGGDGLVVARGLAEAGCRVTVLLLFHWNEMSEDALANLEVLRRLLQLTSPPAVEIVQFESVSAIDDLREADVIVDAMLGTGIESELRDPIRSVVDWINGSNARVVAVDIATGISTDTGKVLGTAVRAQLTVTMAALKVGHVVGDGPDYSGQVEVVDIGIPRAVLDSCAADPGCAVSTTDREVARWFKPRSRDAHKYSAGTLVAAVGSKRFPGAAVMSSSAASRMGAGYVICGAPKSIQSTLSANLTDVTILPLEETVDGNLARSARQGLEERLGKATAILVGCGIGRDSETLDFVLDLVSNVDVPGVIDADGLYALQRDKSALRRDKGREWILTPHWGEFKALVGDDSIDPTDRVRLASRFAQEWGCVLLLKGMPSVVGCPDGRVYINRTGNSGVATAGTGDVLAGFCAGLLAQGLDPVEAAVAGLHIGGAAADMFASRADSRTLVAMDLVNLIPETVKTRFAGDGA